MTALDALMVLAFCVIGSFAIWLVANLGASWKRRRDEDAEFARSLTFGGTLDHETGLFTGTHAAGVPATDILKREATGVHPIAERMASSSE